MVEAKINDAASTGTATTDATVDTTKKEPFVFHKLSKEDIIEN